MDIFNEIDRLPQYYYEWKSSWGIWGSQYYNKARNKIGSISVIMSVWEQLKAYYEQDGDQGYLLDNEKVEYAKAVDRMRKYCEKEELSDDDFDRDELASKINSLSEEDKKEIEWQIDMYKRGQRYYSQYIWNK